MSSLSFSTSRLLVGHARLWVLAAAVLTALLVVPMLLLSTDQVASTDPGGEVFDLRDEIDAKLPTRVFITAYLAEARGGDILRKEPLLELLRNERSLLQADEQHEITPGDLEQREYLIDSYDTDTGTTFHGLLSMADAVDTWLRLVGGRSLENATDDDVKIAVSYLLANPSTDGLLDHLSVEATRERRVVRGQEINYWESPAILLAVYADNAALGGSSSFRGLATTDAELNLERFARNVQAELRGDEQTYELWGLAIDQTLSATEQGQTAGTFIVLTVVAALAVVGIALRAYWPTALTAVGIGALMIWLKGLSALVGIKGGLIIDLIVPIAMVSLGVDFAVHAVRRYYEERAIGFVPGRALTVGMASVIGALFLAMLSDGIAFLSNVPSGIEAVVHFGLAAGIAVLSSFIVLGLIVPLALMQIDDMREAKGRATLPRWAVLAAGAGVTGMTGAGVILLVAVDPRLGAVVLFVTALAFVVAPLAYLRFAPASAGSAQPTLIAPPSMNDAWLSRVVVWLAAKRIVVLPAVALLTAFAGVLAFRLEATFDVKDFFASDSDIVVGLDKLDEHVGARTGEGGIIFIQGNLTDPDVVQALQRFVEDDLAENPFVGKEPDGSPSVFEENLLTMIHATMDSAEGRAAIAEKSGVILSDENGDGIPDTLEQLRALYSYITTFGVPLDPTTNVYAPEVVRETLSYEQADPSSQTTTIYIGIPGTRELSVISAAHESLSKTIAPLEDVDGITRVGLTGSPFVRDAELTATVDNLRRSLPIATAGALVLLLVAFRSVRFSVVTILPIGLVVVWLYAIMEIAGFALNFVSATIGAVSIGVGIDYSIHMTERFREELDRQPTRIEALRRASNGTGVALLASAGSSIVGFAIMGFAPMPMFSTYGILTAVMIFLSLATALMVLPSLLMLITKEPAPTKADAGVEVATGVDVR